MPNVAKRIRNRPIPEDKEIMDTLAKADKIQNRYFRLRVKCLIALAKKFGKRRSEIDSLKLADLEVKEGYLHITFTIRKKHKVGLFQYIKHLKRLEKKYRFEYTNKPLPQLEKEWKEWQDKEGFRIKEEKRTKKVDVNDKYAKLILEYVAYLKGINPEGVYLFPSGKAVFQHYVIDNSRPLSGRHLLRLIKPLNKKLWLHLFREMRGAEVARESNNNIIGVYSVKEALDLEKETTAWNYIHRYGVQEVKPEYA